jgi:ABC-type lipoprotein export system ATPase subunit
MNSEETRAAQIEIDASDTERQSNLLIECENLVKIYKTTEIEVVALQGLDLTVEYGEVMAIIGNSGSGKSTLMNMIGGLDRPSAGKLIVDGKDLLKMTDKSMITYKRETVGFVWQNNARNLIPYLTASENIEMPMIFSSAVARRQRALELLDMVGLTNRKDNQLSQLSGGEQQRVAIAIALANNPALLLADEPTGSVDTKTAGIILDIFREFNKSFGLSVIIVTHDRQVSRKVDRVVAIRDGRTSSEFIRKISYADEINNMGGLSDSTEDTHIEYVVIDKAGRIQIPQEYLVKLGLKGKDKVKVEIEGEKIVIKSPDKIEV